MKKADPSRYPVGKHEYGKSYSFEETRKNIKTIAALPKDLKKILKKLNNDALNKSYRKGGWTVRQIVHHIADSHINAYIRMKMAITETAPIIKPYEEAGWAETDDAKYAPIKISLKLISALSRRWVLFLESLSDEDLERGYFHPALQQLVLLPDAIAAYAWHSRHHLAHIAMVLSGKQFDVENEAKPKKTKGKSAETESSSVFTKEETVAVAPKKRGPKPKAKPEVTADEAPKKRGPKPKVKLETADVAVSIEPKKRGPKPKAKPEATATEAPKKRGMSPEHMAKIREARMAKRAAAGLPTAPKSAPAISTEPKKRGPKPKANPETAVVAVSEAPKKRGPKPKEKPVVSTTEAPKKRGMSPEHMAKIREARMAKRAAAGLTTATKAAPATSTEPKKRGPKPKAKP